MSETLEKQFIFTKMVGELIIFAFENNLKITFGAAYVDIHACPNCGAKVSKHKVNSLHYQRLAVDFNLFKELKKGEDVEFILLKTAQDYLPLGERWESLGGTWGGRFGDHDGDEIAEGWDGNHFSLQHEGMS